jgi:hydrogenase maturation factor HypF (carbamoyltransferase family)
VEEIEEEERRKNNRQAYPLCPMCRTPTYVSDFLRDYQGQRLDIIKVCCKKCIPSFEALPKNEQLERLRLAMIKTYGETAVIYVG